MRIAIDTLGAPTSSGGMRSYVDELVMAWAETFPGDELLVIGYDYVRDLAGPGVTVDVRPESGRSRILGQWVGSGLAARQWGADALVSTSSVVSPLFPRRRRICTVHDWRHRVSPHEFGRAQRAYRRTWQWSLEHAGATVAISTKTVRETGTFAPRARVSLIENGRDHARRWRVVDRPAHDPSATDPRPLVLTFGHFPNKRPELVVEAIAAADLDVRLVVVGARGDHAEELRRRAVDAGCSDRLELPGFVPAPDYQALVRGAAVVVLASSDEGFGLPVAEANHFGVPCVVTADGGLNEIHGERVLVADPTPAAIGTRIAEALGRSRSAPAPDEATWAATATRIRALCEAT